MTTRKATAKAAADNKGEMRGSLRYAVHDTAVNGSGRDDAAFYGGAKGEDKQRQRQKQIPIRLRSGQALRDDKQKDEQ